MEAFRAWVQQLQFGGVLDTAIVVLASLLCITFHETSHGFVAWKLGDPTAKEAGRLSLNPLRHVDIFGLIMMAVFHFGWAKPVPVNMARLRHPRRDMALVSAAGPAANLVMALVAMLLRAVAYFIGYRTGSLMASTTGVLYYVISFLNYVAVLSVGLAVFNLIPIPPLDGSKVLLALLPERVSRVVLRYERFGMILLFAVLWLGWLDTPLTAARSWVLDGMSTITWPLFQLLARLFS